MIGKGIVLLFLAIAAIWDIKKKAVPKNYLCVVGVVAVIYLGLDIMSGKSLIDGILALIPGYIIVFLCVVSGEQIGLGDGLILLCVGCFQNIRDTLCMIFISFVILTLVSMFLLISRRVGRKSTIPFVPFLFCGQLITIVEGFL